MTTEIPTGCKRNPLPDFSYLNCTGGPPFRRKLIAESVRQPAMMHHDIDSVRDDDDPTNSTLS